MTSPARSALQLALAIGLPVAALAQSRSGTPGHGGAASPRRGGAPVYGPVPNQSMLQDPHFMARLSRIRATRIQQVLGLPEDRAKVVAERWGRWDREHIDRSEQGSTIRRQFSQILMGPGTEDEKNAKIKPLMDQLVTLRGQQEAGRRQFEEDVRNGLSPAQQARLILVMDEIQQKLREGLRDVQTGK